LLVPSQACLFEPWHISRYFMTRSFCSCVTIHETYTIYTISLYKTSKNVVYKSSKYFQLWYKTIKPYIL
jgi:hypothetical protein